MKSRKRKPLPSHFQKSLGIQIKQKAALRRKAKYDMEASRKEAAENRGEEKKNATR